MPAAMASRVPPDGGQITAIDEGRARRYFVAKKRLPRPPRSETASRVISRFPQGSHIDVSMLEAPAEWMTMALVSASAIHGTTLSPALAT
ncbi:hypothetical protein D9M69_700590 [compost metagenome]